MKIRLAHLSDIHLEEGSRLNELVTVLGVFIQEAQKAKVDLILLTGDLYDQASTAQERIEVANFLQNCSVVAPTFVVRGNHDARRDLELFAELKTRRLLTVFERPGSWGTENAVVYGLPWFDKSHLVAQLPPNVDKAQSDQLVMEAARQLLVSAGAILRENAAQGRIPILAGHLLVGGSVVSTGQQLQGVSVEFSPWDLAETGAAYVALGHIHAEQHWMDGRVAYAGSPIRQNFGESERKGFRLVEIETAGDGYAVRNDFVELPARRIELYEVDLTDEAKIREFNANMGVQGLSVASHTKGSLVRLRYRISPENLHLIDERAMDAVLRADGAHDVKIEAIIQQETRIRSTEIITAQSTYAKIEAYWQSKGIDPDAEQRGRVRDKLALIEAPEVADVAAA